MITHTRCRSRLLMSMLAIAISIASGSATAQAFPTKPLRFFVGFPPGGGSDLAARVVASGMEKRLGQSVIVENRPGAFGIIAGSAVVKADPDGYSLFFGNIGSTHPVFVKSNGIDAVKELAPVTMLMSGSFVFSMKQGLPAKNFVELVAYAKANPNKVNFGSVGQTTDLLGEVLKQRTGMAVATITYKGDSPAVTALLGGEIDFAGNSVTAALPHIQSGKFIPLFVAKATRSSFLPNVPTSSEVGVRDFEVGYTLGLWAPLGTPRAIIDKLSTEGTAVAKSAEVVERFRSIGGEPLGTTPEEMVRIFEAEMKFWAEAARIAKYQPK